MEHVIVYAHPNSKSFSASIRDHVISLSEDLGNKVTVRDLYKMNFNPVLSPKDFDSIKNGVTPGDIKTEQQFIAKADLITLIFPLWWTGYPAILKGWVDRVLLNGFAYKHTAGDGIKPLLTGKRVQIITTMGASVDEYENNGLMDAMAMTMGDNVWSFCGCEDSGMIVLGEVPGMSDQDRLAVLSEIDGTLAAALGTPKKTKPAAKKAAPAKKTTAAKKPAQGYKKKPAAKKAPAKKPVRKK